MFRVDFIMGIEYSNEMFKGIYDELQGHDTTAAGSSFVLCLLGVHNNIQVKVYDELYEIFGDSDRPVTFSDTLQMKYLERVILETLRMYPPVPAIARKLKRDVMICKIVFKLYFLFLYIRAQFPQIHFRSVFLCLVADQNCIWYPKPKSILLLGLE